jgi:hypothetical protein
MNYNNLIEQARAFRQVDLIRESGLSKATVWAFLKGTRKPWQSTAEALQVAIKKLEKNGEQKRAKRT